MTYPSGRVVNFNYATGGGCCNSRLSSVADATTSTSTAVLLVAATGLVLENNRTLPFGEMWSAPAVSAITKRYTTYERDSESNLDYAGDRYYANGFGRLSAVDHGRMFRAAPVTLNRYVYAGNDPVNHTDRSGSEWYRWNCYQFFIAEPEGFHSVCEPSAYYGGTNPSPYGGGVAPAYGEEELYPQHGRLKTVLERVGQGQDRLNAQGVGSPECNKFLGQADKSFAKVQAQIAKTRYQDGLDVWFGNRNYRATLVHNSLRAQTTNANQTVRDVFLDLPRTVAIADFNTDVVYLNAHMIDRYSPDDMAALLVHEALHRLLGAEEFDLYARFNVGSLEEFQSAIKTNCLNN
jgi:RHS repeat-associated protein